ncbi:MAG: UvrD-helicase domain-containing protein, partial [Actinomycetota bacterium]
MATRDRDHEAAAAFVADALARLDDSWVVLLAPRLGLEQPDAIALHEQHGVCVITATGLRPGQPERHPDGYLVRPETPLRLAEQPHDVAERLGRHVYDGYYAGLEDPPRPTSAVRSIVVAPNFDDHTARELFRARGAADVEAAATVWGAGFARDLDAAVSATASSDAVTIAPSGLRRVLAGALTAPTGGGAMRPAAIRDESQPLVADPAGARFRRVRGVGGTGKTFALTARAAELARQGRDVLVLSFTTTLADRLVDLVRDRCTERGADARHVTVTNFHALSEHTVVSAESIGFTSTWPEGSRWPIAIVDRARQVIEQGFDFRYHAILVDEGQDFSL